MHYRIRIQGHLDPSWQDRFGDYTSSSRRPVPRCSQECCRISQRSMGCSYSSSGLAWCCSRLKRARRKVREQTRDRS
ncbi:hypothetical protein [Ktedonobacter sp. SOSP1-85]|uniref:hypothetical protein n=1 Tax=Ktedonobacter sp. SOSP1-85 TaxID=2778367 RepID=UPI0027DC7443|nr:hypothetical protein [Ktedonobacter sp. SOSP1-85]